MRPCKSKDKWLYLSSEFVRNIIVKEGSSIESLEICRRGGGEGKCTRPPTISVVEVDYSV